MVETNEVNNHDRDILLYFRPYKSLCMHSTYNITLPINLINLGTSISGKSLNNATKNNNNNKTANKTILHTIHDAEDAKKLLRVFKLFSYVLPSTVIGTHFNFIIENAQQYNDLCTVCAQVSIDLGLSCVVFIMREKVKCRKKGKIKIPLVFR